MCSSDLESTPGVPEAGCQSSLSPGAKRSRSLVYQTEMSDFGGRVLAVVGRSAPNEDATVLSDPTAKAVRLINSRRDSEGLLLKMTPFPAGGLRVGALAIIRRNISD